MHYLIVASNMIVYFTFVCQFSADKIIKAFIAKANLASLLITGQIISYWKTATGRVTDCTSIPLIFWL